MGLCAAISSRIAAASGFLPSIFFGGCACTTGGSRCDAGVVRIERTRSGKLPNDCMPGFTAESSLYTKGGLYPARVPVHQGHHHVG
jgi:hypothetical protein